MKKRSILVRSIVSIGATSFFLWIAFRQRDVSTLWDQLLTQSWWWFTGLFALHLFSHFLRAIRWRYLIHPVKNTVSLHNAFSALMIGFMINGFLPRAGEIARAYILGKREAIPAASLISTVILERLLDFTSFAILLCIVAIIKLDAIVVFFPTLSGFEWVIDVIALSLLAAFVVVFLKSKSIITFVKMIARFFPEQSRSSIEKGADLFAHGLQASTIERHYGIIALLSCSIWFAYIVLLYLPMELFGMVHLTFLTASVLQLMSGLAAAMPTPNGIGSYHSFNSYALITMYHVPGTMAIAYVVYTHAISYLCTLIVGLGYFAREQLTVVDALEIESAGVDAENTKQ